MIFARAVMIACLKVLGYLLFFTAALVLIMFIINWRDGDPHGKLTLNAILAVAFAVGGIASFYFARFFEKM